MLTEDGTDVSAVWQHLVDLDLDEVRRARDKMKLGLARYARQSLWAWDDRPVSELVYWYGLLGELVSEENVATHAGED